MLIYLIRNIVNGKGYVGQTIRTLEERWKQHKQQGIHRYKHDALHNAILKYGLEAFEVAVLDDSATTLEELNRLEQFHIKTQRTLSPHGYNLTTGGYSYQRSAETLAKMSAIMKGRKPSAKTIAKIVAARRGRKLSSETRAKIAFAHKGKPGRKGFKHSPESIAKRALWLNSPENKARMSALMKGNQHAKGYRHTPEELAKISAAGKGKSAGKGHIPWNKGQQLPSWVRAKLSEGQRRRRERENKVIEIAS